MSSVFILATGLSKDFNRRTIFKEINFELHPHSSLAISGRNGAGKSTLAKILAGLISKSSGSLAYQCDGRPAEVEEILPRFGFVAPYLNLYDEFTAVENVVMLSRIRGNHQPSLTVVDKTLERVGLLPRRDSQVRTYSSGMKQRLKYAFAIIHEPEVLILDEPTANLDTEGSSIVRAIVEEQKSRGILIVATNDADEVAWCEQRIHLG